MSQPKSFNGQNNVGYMILMNFFSFGFGTLDIFVIWYSLIVKTVLKRKNVVWLAVWYGSNVLPGACHA